jgi:hypothetical protein
MPLDETTATIQYRAATDIAEARFKFPSDEWPDLETHVNLPTLKMPVDAGGRTLGPDIVVTNADGTVQSIAAVETPHTVNEASARERWLPFSRIDAPFYLYVPAGAVNQTKKLLKNAGVKRAKIRTWRYIAGLNWTLDLTDITHDFSVNDLVPPIVVNFLEKRREKAEAGRQEKDREKAELRAAEEAREEERRQAREARRAEEEARRAAEPQYPHTTPPRP